MINNNLSISGEVRSVAQNGNTLFMGGSIAYVNGVKKYNVASIDLVSGNPTSFAPKFNGIVRAVRSGVTRIAFGGNFSTVEYKGVILENCLGIVVYDVLTDEFFKIPGISKAQTISCLSNIAPDPTFIKIIYHPSQGIFYCGGHFLFDINNAANGNDTNKNGFFSFYELSLQPIINPFQGIFSVASGGCGVPTVADMDIDFSTDTLYLAGSFGPSVSSIPAASMSWSIADPINISSNNWYPIITVQQISIRFADGKIWICGYDNFSGPTYQKTFSSPPQNFHGVAIIDAVTKDLTLTDFYMVPKAFAPVLPAISFIHEDATHITMFGTFGGAGYYYSIGAPWFLNLSRTISSIAKFKKTDYSQAINEPIDTHSRPLFYNFYGNGIWSRPVPIAANINDVFLHDNKWYLFGSIGAYAGYERNPHDPLIINADLSKIQTHYIF